MGWKERKVKGRQLLGVEPRTPLAWATSALPLSHDSQMTTNPHNPLLLLYLEWAVQQKTRWRWSMDHNLVPLCTLLWCKHVTMVTGRPEFSQTSIVGPIRCRSHWSCLMMKAMQKWCINCDSEIIYMPYLMMAVLEHHLSRLVQPQTCDTLSSLATGTYSRWISICD